MGTPLRWRTVSNAEVSLDIDNKSLLTTLLTLDQFIVVGVDNVWICTGKDALPERSDVRSRFLRGPAIELKIRPSLYALNN